MSSTTKCLTLHFLPMAEDARLIFFCEGAWRGFPLRKVEIGATLVFLIFNIYSCNVILEIER